MNKKEIFTKEQIDFVKHCGEHFEVLTGGRGHSKTKEMIQQLQNQVEKLTQENNDLEERVIHQDNVIKQLQEENNNLKQPQIFIDTEDMEERYGNDLYVEYLEKEKEHLQSVIDKAIKYLKEKEDSLFMTFDDEFLSHDELIDKKIGLTLLEILRSKE